MIRVTLPAHLRTLAQVDGEVEVEVGGQATQRAVLDALEARYPMLCGTIRDRSSGRRRAFIRLSNELPDEPLPASVAAGTEPFMVVGAMAGG
jgi:molybdopterin synthase sulfur carrier subunit